MLNTLILLDVCLCPIHRNVYMKYVKLSVCQLSSIKLFPWFVVIHTVRGFSVVNEAKVDVFFWNFLAFSMIKQRLEIWLLVPLPFPTN